ncbi:phosphotransferase enzyme family protein [Bacteroidota bacterium]
MNYNLNKLMKNFCIRGTFESGEAYGSGHINDTFLVKTKEENVPDYILQRINHNIFKNVPALMDNIGRVTRHIRKKLIEIPGSDPDREGLTLIPTDDGKDYYKDENGNFWRTYIFISNNRSYDIVDSPEKAYEGGKAFGKYQAMIADLPGEPLHETIPDFHDISVRLNTFFEILEKNSVNRAKLVKEELTFVKERAEEMKRILHLGREGKIPLRITHNDTKFNNVLLDENDKKLCVIDLDTVMPGYVHYDFGDSIRTSTNTGAEDEKDLSKVNMDINLFEAYTKGFLEETNFFLNQCEKENLAFAGKLFPFIIGLRFLTDYIDGDNYFKIHHEHHNLQRAKAQFKLLLSMEEQFVEMQNIVRKYA